MITDESVLKMMAARAEEKQKRRELEQQLHDGSLYGTQRYVRAKRIAAHVLALTERYIPDACRDAAYEEVLLRAFEADVEIVRVTPERDAMEAAERRVMETTVSAAVFMPLGPEIVPPRRDSV